jgi:hypothetical protein
VKCRSFVTGGLLADEKFAGAELAKIFTSFGALKIQAKSGGVRHVFIRTSSFTEKRGCAYVLNKELQVDASQQGSVVAFTKSNIQKHNSVSFVDGLHNGWIWTGRINGAHCNGIG